MADISEKCCTFASAKGTFSLDTVFPLAGTPCVSLQPESIKVPMKVKNFAQYSWLVNTISTAGRISLSDLQEKWRNTTFYLEGEGELNRRKLLRMRNGIVEFFGVFIECDLSSYTYYIANKSQYANNDVRKWLLDSFAVHEMLHASVRLHDRIIFEDIPSGNKYLLPILDAMRSGKWLEMSYKGFRRAEAHTFLVAPYCLKVFKQRWYLVGQSTAHDEIRIYSLDRVQSLSITSDTFTLPADFDGERYFRGFYGVITDRSVLTEDVIIRVDGMTANYLRSLPLHSSQRELEPEGDFSLFSYHVAPTYDFIQELRTQGADLEVVSPLWLREQFKKEVEMMVKRYK